MSRRIRTEDDYLVAGRSLGPVLTTFTIFATWFGAETCVVAAGEVYQRGLSGTAADPFGYGLCILLVGLFLAVPLWRMKLTTLGDLFRRRYSPGVERLAVVLMVPTSVFWAAAQVRAFGQVLSSASGLEVDLMIAVAASVVIAYTIFGGLLADAWTDLVQGIALIVGLAVLALVVVRDVGLEGFLAVEPHRLNPFGGGRPLLSVVEDWAIPVVGSLVAAELVARVIAARSPEVARRGALLGGVVYIGIGTIPVMLGLVGAGLVTGLQDPEQFLPVLAQQYLPVGLYVVFAGALVSAILSTVDSALLVAGSLVSHNLVVHLLPGMTERGKVRVARGCVAAFGILAYLLAVRAEGVYSLVEQASAFGSAGIVTVTLFGIFSPVGGPAAAAASLGAGVLAWIGGAYVADVPYPYLASLAVAFVAYVGVARLTPAGERVRTLADAG